MILQEVWPWILFFDLVMRLVLVVRVILRRAPVSISLAWLVVLLFVPIFGLPLYVVIGEVRLGTRRARRHAALTQDLEQRATIFWRAGADDWTDELEQYRSIARLCSAVTNMPPLKGNQLSILADCQGFINQLITDFDAAKTRIDILTYIWMDPKPGSAGDQVAQAIIRAAKRGVKCRILVDGVGSKIFLRSKMIAEMRAAGAVVTEALPASLWRMPFVRLDVRNHRKIAVVDGWIAHCGSQNITDDSFGCIPHRNIGPWIDASVRVKGPAAQALHLIFMRDWQLDSYEEPEPTDKWERLPALPKYGSVVQVVATGPGEAQAGKGRGLQEALLSSFYTAKKEIFITTPYFVPDESSLSALTAAAMRGVDVRIVLPARNDNRFVKLASQAQYTDLLAAGVRIFEHQKGLLHSKTITIDTDISLVGSANMDMRSFFLNFEVTLFVYDNDFTGLVRMLQVKYLDESQEVFRDEWQKQPVLKRVFQDGARLLGPLL